MREFRRSFLGAALAAGIAIGIFPTSASQSLGEELRIAHDRRFPPFVEVVDGASRGLAVDLLRAAAARAGVKITFVPVPFEEVQKTLADGRADAIFPLAINPERQRLFDFSAPLLVTGGGLFVRAPAPAPATFDGLAGRTVVTPKTGPLAAYIAKNAAAVKLVVVSDYDESLRMLMSGEADAAALNFQAGARIANRLYSGKISVPDRLFLELPLAVAVPKGKGESVLAKIDAGLQAIRGDGSWQKINAEWTGR